MFIITTLRKTVTKILYWTFVECFMRDSEKDEYEEACRALELRRMHFLETVDYPETKPKGIQVHIGSMIKVIKNPRKKNNGCFVPAGWTKYIDNGTRWCKKCGEKHTHSNPLFFNFDRNSYDKWAVCMKCMLRRHNV